MEAPISPAPHLPAIVNGIPSCFQQNKAKMAKEIVAEFRELWNSSYALFYDEFYENYKERYKIIKHQREIAKRNKKLLQLKAIN